METIQRKEMKRKTLNKGEELCLKEPEKEVTLKSQNQDEEKSRRELRPRQLPDGLYVIFWEGGGELPNLLSGKYTGIHKAQQAINHYYTVQRIR